MPVFPNLNLSSVHVEQFFLSHLEPFFKITYFLCDSFPNVNLTFWPVLQVMRVFPNVSMFRNAHQSMNVIM